MKQVEFLKRLQKLKKPYYTVSDLQMILGQNRATTRKEIHRFVKNGVLKRMGKNIYISPLFSYDLEEIAASLYAPCYLSFESALAKYGILSQIPYTLSFATLRRSKKITLENQEIEYRRLKPELFFGYKWVKGLPVAKPEKALLDELYMVSLGKAKLDFEELDLDKLSPPKLKNMAKKFPSVVRKKILELINYYPAPQKIATVNPWCGVYQKFGKRGIDILLSFLGIVFLWPVFLIIAILIKLDSEGPVIFKQKRVGKDGKIFIFYKFRNMVKNAEKLKKKLAHLNEANGPVFKIRNDPRYTRVGKFLSHTGLDELPQLFNILKGEMSLVGPRPLPVEEEVKIPKKWRAKRRLAKPGLACSWLLNGAHSLSFDQWMRLDLEDIKKCGLFYDLGIFFRVVILGLNLVKKEAIGTNHFPF